MPLWLREEAFTTNWNGIPSWTETVVMSESVMYTVVLTLPHPPMCDWGLFWLSDVVMQYLFSYHSRWRWHVFITWVFICVSLAKEVRQRGMLPAGFCWTSVYLFIYFIARLDLFFLLCFRHVLPSLSVGHLPISLSEAFPSCLSISILLRLSSVSVMPWGEEPLSNSNIKKHERGSSSRALPEGHAVHTHTLTALMVLTPIQPTSLNMK